MSLAKREALLDLSRRFAIPVVEDSPYRMLGYYGRPLPSLYSLDQQRGGENVIGVYTFSKLFCPGMRVGFNIGPAPVVQKMTNIKEGNVLNTPKYNQDMCTAYLTEMQPDAHLERCRAYYREKLERLLEELADAFPAETGVTWTRPAGGLFVWVTLPAGIDTRELFHDAIRHKVAFVPGDVFYAENPARNHLRLNFSYPSQGELTEAVRRLAVCIRNRLGRTETR
jgi:2-aminoadipate transaminase